MDQQAPAPPPQQSGLAIASLVCGIIGLLGLGPLTGIPAIITGSIARKKIRLNPEIQGAGTALAGIIMGWIATILGTLAIIMIVVAMMMAAANTFSTGVTETAREQATEARIREFEAKVEVYRMMAGTYPSEEQGLMALVERPATNPQPRKWRKQSHEIPADPWGGAYVYKYPGSIDPSTFEIISAGPDMTIATGDDISSQAP